MIPVLLLGGFLGSGKTTLLKALLAQPALARSAVVVNEFGEVGIDHLLVERLEDDIALLDSGCLCCAASDDLIGTLNGLLARADHGLIPMFDRVWIETSGLVDPSGVLLALSSRPDLDQRFKPPRLITVADAVHGRDTLAQQPENAAQLALADVVLISKTDVADPSWVTLFAEELQRINPTAIIDRIAQGHLSPSLVQTMIDGGQPSDIVARLTHGAATPGTLLQPQISAARHAADLQSFVLSEDQPLPIAVFVEWLTLLLANRGEDILRVKGFLRVDDQGPLLVHGVQHVVYPFARKAQWPEGLARRTQLVMITRGLPQSSIERSFRRLWETEFLSG